MKMILCRHCFSSLRWTLGTGFKRSMNSQTLVSHSLRSVLGVSTRRSLSSLTQHTASSTICQPTGFSSREYSVSYTSDSQLLKGEKIFHRTSSSVKTVRLLREYHAVPDSVYTWGGATTGALGKGWMKMILCRHCFSSLRWTLGTGFKRSMNSQTLVSHSLRSVLGVSTRRSLSSLTQHTASSTICQPTGFSSREYSVSYTSDSQLLKGEKIFHRTSSSVKTVRLLREYHAVPDSVYTWGGATTGALGTQRYEANGVMEDCLSSPHSVEYTEENNMKPVIAAAGYGYTLLLLGSACGQRLIGGGLNTDLQLGYQENHMKPGHNDDLVMVPCDIDVPVSLMADNSDKVITSKIISISCGRAHSWITTDRQQIFSVGNDVYGQCGRRRDPDRVNKPMEEVMFSKNIKQICCGFDHTLVLTDEGQVYSCGLGADGQTGLGHYDAVDELSLVQGDIKDEQIICLSGKVDCVLALSERGDVFGWGNSEYGQLDSVACGETQVNVPRRLPISLDNQCVKVAASGTMCAVLDAEGDMYTWGYGGLGGHPGVEMSRTPQRLPRQLFGGDKLTHIDCGINHFAAITNSGKLYIWGRDRNGSLGVGDEITNSPQQYQPNKVDIPGRVLDIACGSDHNVALCAR